MDQPRPTEPAASAHISASMNMGPGFPVCEREGWRTRCRCSPDLTPFLICEGSFFLASACAVSSTRNTTLDYLSLTLSLHNKDVLKNPNNLTLGKRKPELQRDAHSDPQGRLQSNTENGWHWRGWKEIGPLPHTAAWGVKWCSHYGTPQ